MFERGVCGGGGGRKREGDCVQHEKDTDGAKRAMGCGREEEKERPPLEPAQIRRLSETLYEERRE